MTEQIANIQDLAQHLGADEATSKAIARRIYKDTSCGCSSSFEADAVIEKHSRPYLRTYTVECRLSIGGVVISAWRPEHGKKRLVPTHPLPHALAEYMICADGNGRKWIGSDMISETYSRSDVREEFGRDFMRDLKADAKPGQEGVVRVTRRGPLISFVTVQVLETRDRVCRAPKFSVSGYCEGTDIECDSHEVFLSCTPDAIDDAISQADKDGRDLWDQTHGCQKCHPDGTCDEWGNEWSPDGDNWIGQPVNPDCVECKGSGVVL